MDAALVIVVLPNWSAGLQWEIDTIIERGHVEKMIMVFPADQYRQERWQGVRDRFAGTKWHSPMRSVDPSRALAVALQADRVVVICSEEQAAGNLEAAINLAMYSMFCHDQQT